MSRRIRVAGPATAAGPVDTYFDKVVKYIPADIVGAWVAVTGLVTGTSGAPRQTILWVAFVVGLILTAWWTLRQAAAPGRRPAATQAIVSTGAFAVWVYALGGPFEHVPGQKLYGSLLLILYTLVAALVDPRES